jgi:hypothetical protein
MRINTVDRHLFRLRVMPPITRIGLYLQQIRDSHNVVLQFDYQAGRGLNVWKW